jgi:protoporphyrinogen oxidase
MPERHVLVLGAGVAGLTAALRLVRAGVRVSLLEKESRAGGLARAFGSHGLLFDRYYHYLTGQDDEIRRLCAEVLPDHPVVWRSADVGLQWGGRLHPFSTPADLLGFPLLSPTSRLRLGLHFARCAWSPDPDGLQGRPAIDWLKTWLGVEAYRAVWEPLLVRKFGPHAPSVSAAWIRARIGRMASQARPALWRRTYGFIPGGAHRLVDRLAEAFVAAGGTLRLGCPVDAIEARGGLATAVRGGHERWTGFDALISTLPLPTLASCLEGADLPPSPGGPWPPRVDYLPVCVLVLRLSRSLSRFFWLNTNDPDSRVAGIIEYTNLDPRLATRGQSLLYLPFYWPTDPHIYRDDAAALLDWVAPSLRRVHPDFSPGWVLEQHVFRDQHGQSLDHAGRPLGWSDGRTPLANLFATDAYHLHPDDRSLDGSVRLGDRAAGQALAATTEVRT